MGGCPGLISGGSKYFTGEHLDQAPPPPPSLMFFYLPALSNKEIMCTDMNAQKIVVIQFENKTAYYHRWKIILMIIGMKKETFIFSLPSCMGNQLLFQK